MEAFLFYAFSIHARQVKLVQCFVAVYLFGVVASGNNPAVAQVEIQLEPHRIMGTDTLWVSVRMIGPKDTLEISIESFQFTVVADMEVKFLGSQSDNSLAGKEGWMSRHNAENGRVGGFSSSLDAIETSGVLIRLQFLVLGTDTPGNVELQEFRLNSGTPDHFPAVPSLSLNPINHQE